MLVSLTVEIYSITYKADEVWNTPLVLDQLPSDGMQALQQWIDVAKSKLGERDATTMVLATVSSDNKPYSRAMMAKSIDKEGLVIYGNKESVKFQQLQEKPFASITFYWPALQRQLTIRGCAVQVSDAEAKAYFATRSKSSQMASWASSQGRPLKKYEQLINKYKEIEAQYRGREIVAPTYWVGYRIVPTDIELWQAGVNTLHERVLYQKDVKGKWTKMYLYP